MKNKIGVIIVDYNSIKKSVDYACCLNEYIGSEEVSYIIVENCQNKDIFNQINNYTVLSRLKSDDDRRYSQRYKIECCGIDIDILHAKENYGYAIGNNIGAEFCKREYVPDFFLFSNNDIILDGRLDIRSLLENFSRDEKIVAVGPQVIGIDGRQQGPYRKMDFLWGGIFYLFFPPSLKKKHEELINSDNCYVYWTSGCFVLMKSEVFCAVGMYDENTFLYCEEMILAEKFLKNGQLYYYDANQIVIHEGGASTSRVYNDWHKYILSFKSRMYYFREYRKVGLIRITFAWCYFIVGLCLHRIKHGIIRLRKCTNNM